MNAVVEMTASPTPRRNLPAVASPLDIVQSALKSGNVDMYREAVALFKDLDAFAARKAFNNALSDAKAKLPILKKNRLVSFGTTSYRHEDLAEVVRTVVPILSEYGLSHRYRLSGEPGKPVTVTCIISHRDGYFEENTLSAGADTSGSKNPIQAVKSAVTYLERITLVASLGLAASEDDDGRSSSETVAEEYTPPAGSITANQAAEIYAALEEKGASQTAFLQWAKKPRVENIASEHFASCMAAIAKFKKV